MSFARPTLAEIVARIQVDFVSRLELTGAVLRRSMVYVLSRVIAGASHMLHGHLDFLGRQLFPDQSDDAYLVRQAAVFGLTKTPPTFATATSQINGTTPTVCPAGSILIRSDGAEYTVDADVALSGSPGVASIALTAVLAGADYTLTTGVVLTFQSPIVGINSTSTVIDTVADGTDEETTEALRIRLLERMASPPMGGNEADLIAWAKEVAGVTRAWVYPLELGAGSVVVRFVRDNDAGGIIPSGGEVTEVQDHLDEEAPATMAVTAAAPTDAPIAFTIAVVPNTVAVKAAVEAELTDLFLRVGEPARTMLLSEFRTAIGTAPGLTDYTLTVPAANVTHTTGQLPSKGTVTWI